jgi:hypothetical protein
MPETLFLVIPCYNEEDILPGTARELDKKVRDLINNKVFRKTAGFFSSTTVPKTAHGTLSSSFTAKTICFRESILPTTAANKTLTWQG